MEKIICLKKHLIFLWSFDHCKGVILKPFAMIIYLFKIFIIKYILNNILIYVFYSGQKFNFLYILYILYIMFYYQL